MNIGAVSQSVGACASVRWKVGESQGKRGGQVGGTRLGRNSGCTKRKLHLHGCLPTPGPCFWSGRGAAIDFGANFDYNTTPPIAHRPPPSALCPPRVFKYRRALYKHSGFKKVACGCSNWTLVILPPGADSPNHLVRKTWYESQAGERDMMMILWQRFHWQTATLRELKSNLLCTFTAGLIAYIRNRNGLWA